MRHHFYPSKSRKRYWPCKASTLVERTYGKRFAVPVQFWDIFPWRIIPVPVDCALWGLYVERTGNAVPAKMCCWPEYSFYQLWDCHSFAKAWLSVITIAGFFPNCSNVAFNSVSRVTMGTEWTVHWDVVKQRMNWFRFLKKRKSSTSLYIINERSPRWTFLHCDVQKSQYVPFLLMVLHSNS